MFLQPMENPLVFSTETMKSVLRCPTLPWIQNKPAVIENYGIKEEDILNLSHFAKKSHEEYFMDGGASSQLPRVNSPVDSNNSDIMDLIGAYILFDFSKKAHEDTIIQKKQRQIEISTRSPVFLDLEFRVPKKQRSKRGKPLKDFANSALTSNGFLKKFGKSVIKASSKEKALKLNSLISDLGQNCNSKSLKRCRESRETEEKKLKRQKKNNARAKFAEWGLDPPPNMPAKFKNLIEDIGGSEVKLLIQKIIYKTDLSEGHNRLQIPMNQVLCDFLTENEKRKLEKGMDVLLVEPSCKISKIHLTKWNMGNTEVFVLNKQWKSVVAGNKTLKQDSVVQIWSFRRGPESELCFAMVTVREGED